MDTVCDIDGGTVKVEPVTVSWRGRTFVVNICENEAPTLESLEAAGSGTPRGAKNTKPQGHAVIPID